MTQPALPLVEPPHDLELERNCLGAMSYRPANVPLVVDTGLEPGHFFAPDHARQYGELLEAWINDQPLVCSYDAPQVSRPDLYAAELLELAARRSAFFAAAGIEAGAHLGWPEWWAARVEHPSDRDIGSGPYPDRMYHLVRNVILADDEEAQVAASLVPPPDAHGDERAARRVLALCGEGSALDRHEEAVSRVKRQGEQGLITSDRVWLLACALEYLARIEDPSLLGRDLRSATMVVLRSKPT